MATIITEQTEEIQQNARDAEDLVQLQSNEIEASEIKGGYISWRLTGRDQSPVVSPAAKKSMKMTLQANVIACFTPSGKVDNFKFTRQMTTKPGKDFDDAGLDEVVQYANGEEITLAGQYIFTMRLHSR